MEESQPKKPDEGSMKLAVHGLFAKIQEKTGLEDGKIEEFQKKWLEVPETRTKYKHWWDATAIGGEELYAMFNDIIDYVQAQEVGQSHVFSALRQESEKVLKNPKTYFQHLVGLGKGWMGRGMGWAKSWMNHGRKCETSTPPPIKMEEDMAETEKEEGSGEELSDFEKAELEDRKAEEEEGAEKGGREGVPKKSPRKTPKPKESPAKAKAKPAVSKTRKPAAKRKTA